MQEDRVCGEYELPLMCRAMASQIKATGYAAVAFPND